MTTLRVVAARIRLALLCATLAAAGGALPARAMVEAPGVIAVVVTDGRLRTLPADRAHAEVHATLPRSWRDRLAFTRWPRSRLPAAAHPLYLAHRALLR